MNDNTNLTNIPTNTGTNSQAEDLRQEISAYAEPQATLLEEIDKKTSFLQEQLDITVRQRIEILELRRQNYDLGHEIHVLKETVTNLDNEINLLQNALSLQGKIRVTPSGPAFNRICELQKELYEAKQKIENLSVTSKNISDQDH